MDQRPKLSLVDSGKTPPAAPPLPDKLWTVKQASEWLSISEQSFRTMLKRRQIPSQAILKLGRRVRLRSELLRDWALRQHSA